MTYSLITGGSSGLGFDIARLLVKKNRDLIIIGRQEKKLQSAQIKLNEIQSSSKILTYCMDLSDEKQIQTFSGFLKQDNFLIGDLYNVAGSGSFGNVSTINAQQIHQNINDNLISLILITTTIVCLIKEQQNQGRIISVLSTAALRGKAGESLYCASKWGARGFLKALENEEAKSGIDFLTVYPGGMKTDFWQNIDLDTTDFMKPKEVAEKIVIESMKPVLSRSELIIERPR